MASLLTAAVACDSPKADPPPAKAAASAAAPAVPTTVAAAVAPAAAPALAPAKKLADCDKNSLGDLSSPELEAALRLKAQKPKGPLSAADLQRVRGLNLSQLHLDELDPCLMRHMKGLHEFFLGPGKIHDLTPLAGLAQLESLRASMNPIVDLSPLAGLTRLDRLDLAHTQVRDLSPLAGLTNLTELLLDDTQVVDITPLASLAKLEVLVLKNTQVKDVSALKALKALKTLDLRGAPVNDETVPARAGLRVQQ